MMNRRVLFVDDDTNILKSFKRALHGHFEVELAEGPEAGLEKVRTQPKYAAVVSDLKMPKMDGVHFLEKVKAARPDTVRIILTGYADLQSAMDAVNRDYVFRFLTKPCDDEALIRTLEAAVAQYELIQAERTLLEKTLKGCIELLSDALSYVNPEAFGRASRVKRFAGMLAQRLEPTRVWQHEITAMLSQIGCLTLPEGAMQHLVEGKELSSEERQLFDMHPFIGSSLLGKIPRMAGMAKAIAYQEKHFDGSGIPLDPVKGEEIPLGARILHVALDFELEVHRGAKWCQAFAILEQQAPHYDPAVLKALEESLGVEARYDPAELPLGELKAGMLLNQDMATNWGLLWAAKGVELTHSMIVTMREMSQHGVFSERVEVLVPVQQISTAAGVTAEAAASEERSA
jgi:response regulator RpfG family c-di-GMP phosphodiesterase